MILNKSQNNKNVSMSKIKILNLNGKIKVIII